MSNRKDHIEAQARTFRAAAIGSVIANNTLEVRVRSQNSPALTMLPEEMLRNKGVLRFRLGGLREYLRRRRQKRRAKRVDRLRQALVSAGVTAALSESSQRLSVIESRLEEVLFTIALNAQGGRTENLSDPQIRSQFDSARPIVAQSENSQRLSVIEGRFEELLHTIARTPQDYRSERQAVEADKNSNGVGSGVVALSADMAILRARVDALVNRNLIQLTDERVAVRTPYGYVICPQREYHLIIYLSEGGAHEPGTCRVLEAVIEPGDHVIDVGAQVGLLTLVMARAIGASGSVLAIEASQVLADCIRRTLSTNGLLERCNVLQTAVSDKAGTVTFHFARRSGHSSLFPLSEESHEVEVQSVPLDGLVSSGERISLVKVDVEGAELLVLHGMSRILEENPEVLLLVEFGPFHLARVGQTIAHWLGSFRDRGFDHILEIDEELGVCRPVRSEIELSKVHSINLLFARSGSSRIARIPQP